jgi:hypothetical protein
LPWVCADDLGAIAAAAFAAPERFLGQELGLASDVQTLAQCRDTYREVMGRDPPQWPMPVWVFGRFGFMGRDLTAMWRWLGTAEFEIDPGPTRALLSEAQTVRSWLSRQRAGQG